MNSYSSVSISGGCGCDSGVSCCGSTGDNFSSYSSGGASDSDGSRSGGGDDIHSLSGSGDNGISICR